MILVGWDFNDLGHPILLSDTENIERIDNLDIAASYRACLQALDQYLITLNNLHWANVSAIVEIEVARASAELHLFQEELKKEEEACTRGIQKLTSTQSGLDNEVE